MFLNWSTKENSHWILKMLTSGCIHIEVCLSVKIWFLLVSSESAAVIESRLSTPEETRASTCFEMNKAHHPSSLSGSGVCTCLWVTSGSHSVHSTTLACSISFAFGHWLFSLLQASSSFTPSRWTIRFTAWDQERVNIYNILILLYTVVNIWSGSKKWIKVVLRQECILGQLWWSFFDSLQMLITVYSGVQKSILKL